MVMTKMNWSDPNCNFQRPKITIWTWTIHFGRDHFILVMTKSLWSSPNQFGQTKTILDWTKLFWSHTRTRHLFSAMSPLTLSRYFFSQSSDNITAWGTWPKNMGGTMYTRHHSPALKMDYFKKPKNQVTHLVHTT